MGGHALSPFSVVLFGSLIAQCGPNAATALHVDHVADFGEAVDESSGEVVVF